MNNFIKIVIFILINFNTQISFSNERCTNLFLPIFLINSQLQTKQLTIEDFETVDNPFEHGLVEINRNDHGRYNYILNRTRDRSADFAFDPKHYIFDAGGGQNSHKNKVLLNELYEKYPQLVNIIYHPGVLFRLKQFLNFIKDHPNATLNEALDLFSVHLGNRVYYRSLYLDKKTAQSFLKKEKNILAHNLYFNRRYVSRPPDITVKFSRANKNKPIDFTEFSTSFFYNIRDHIIDRSSKFVLSVTEYPEVALAVGQTIKSENPSSRKRIYLAKFVLPVINTIPSEGIVSNDFYITIKLGDKVIFRNLEVSNEKVESMVLFGIDRHDILDFSENDTPYSFKMTKKRTQKF